MLYMKVKTVNSNSSHHKGKYIFCFFKFLSIWDDKCLLNLLWESFHGVCKSNHYAVHLKLVQCCMSIISQ